MNIYRNLVAAAAAVTLAAFAAPNVHAQMGGGGGKGGGRHGGAAPSGDKKPAAPGKGPPAGGEFNGATFTCLEYTNGVSETSSGAVQTAFARFWLQGNLAGYYKSQDKLTMSGDTAARDDVMARMSMACLHSPAASIMVVGLQGLGAETLTLPKVLIGDLSLDGYSCKEHLASKSNSAGDAVKSDIAEMWAFAFIQGYNFGRDKDVVVPIQSKPVLINAILKSCAANPSMTLLDTAALVAEKVKLK